MRDVELRHVIALLEFMYAGEVNVAQAHLPGFLKTAESLQIRGLTDASKENKDNVSQNQMIIISIIIYILFFRKVFHPIYQQQYKQINVQQYLVEM